MPDASDVETREAAWLSVTNDALPDLTGDDNALFPVLQAFDQVATRRTQVPSIYVQALHVGDARVSNQRIRPQYRITLDVHWPVRTGTAPIAATEQQNLRSAVAQVIARVRGLPGDKSHGGRFLSVAEVPSGETVAYGDPAQTIPADRALTATISYSADDFEVTG